MLVSKDTPKVGDVVSILLVSGAEIIGKLMASDDNSCRLSRPIAAVMQPTGREIGLAFAPLMATANDINEVTFFQSAMLCKPAKTRDDIAQGYTASTSSIVQPPKGIIIP